MLELEHLLEGRAIGDGEGVREESRYETGAGGLLLPQGRADGAVATETLDTYSHLFRGAHEGPVTILEQPPAGAVQVTQGTP